MEAMPQPLQLQTHRPSFFGILIPAHDLHGRSDLANGFQYGFFADVAKVPDLVGGGDRLQKKGGELVVGVGDDRDSQSGILSANRRGAEDRPDFPGKFPSGPLHSAHKEDREEQIG